MRLLLTSSAFQDKAVRVRAKFFDLVGKSPADIKVAFIPTASAVENDRAYMNINRRELEEMGIPAENITNLELDHPVTLEELGKYNVIFVDGGNTFYLLQKVREFGFDRAIKEYLDQDLGVYVGVSAGTVIMGPDIEFAESWDDKNKAMLENTQGLGYTQDAYSPHYNDGEKAILDEWRSKVNYSIKELRDGQAVVIDKARQEFIG